MKLREGIYSVGVQNPSLRVFDIIMATKYGSSYNAYLVQGEKTALIETVHEDYTDEYIANIEAITAVADIDYIILNHTEPDHSGSLAKLLELNPQIEVYATIAALKNLAQITNRTFPSHTVKDGESLDLGGGMVLDFVVAPNLHWPDSMFTYCAKEKALFSCDVFGCHYCEPTMLDTGVKYPMQYLGELKNYFDAIFGPFRPFVLSGLAKLAGREIELIAPSHGPVLTETVPEVMEQYRIWSAPKATEKYAAIFYVSAYGYTGMLADEIAEGCREAGCPAVVYNLVGQEEAMLAATMNEAAGVAFGSCTINREAVKPVYDLISCTDSVNLKKKPAFAFGSYGWSGEAVPSLTKRLEALKYALVNEGVKVVFKPTESDLAAAREAGAALAAAVLAAK